MAKCDGWCIPLYIYIFLAVMSLLATIRMHMRDPEHLSTEIVVMSIIYKIFWCGVIYVLCSTCHDTWAWVILLLPLIFIVLALFLLFGMLGEVLAHSHNRQH